MRQRKRKRPTRADYQRQAKIIKVMGSGSRLLIVDHLRNGERTVGELTRLLGSDQSTVSKHLALLRAHGIVEDRREGNLVYYRLQVPCVLDLLSCSRQLLRERGQ